MMNKDIASVRNILIINLGGIGDILLSTPALKALRSRFKEADISMLVVPGAYELVKDLPYIDNTFLFYVSHGYQLFLKGIFKDLTMLLFLRKRHFDLAINMRTLVSEGSALKIKLLLSCINPKLKTGRDTAGRGGFFDIKIFETDEGDKYEMDYDIELAEALGAEVSDRKIDFEIDEGTLKKVKGLLENEGIAAEDIVVGIHLGGKPSHMWPTGNLLKALEEINRAVKCNFIVTAQRRDLHLINQLIKRSRIKIINMAGKLNIKELGALIKMCSIYISNDTGPMHIAAALGVPLVAIFGPGYISRFDPRNISNSARVLYQKAECAPCNRLTCKSMKCLKAITPQEAVGAVLGLLKGKGY